MQAFYFVVSVWYFYNNICWCWNNLCLPLLVVPNLITTMLQLQCGQFLLFMCYLLVKMISNYKNSTKKARLALMAASLFLVVLFKHNQQHNLSI